VKKKWIISAGVALALGALGTVAVAGHGGKMRGHRQPMPWMLERLDLTEEQEEQLQALRKEQRESMREQRETMAAMGEEQREAVMNILTEEQQETLEEMRGRRGKFFDRRGGMGAFSRLDLTDEQKEQLQALRKEQRESMREQREAMAAMGEEQREAVMNILTEEQQETLEEMRGRRGKFFDRGGGKGKDRFDMWRGGKGRYHPRRGALDAYFRPARRHGRVFTQGWT
jgi:Spy/CpxP family protein refolding chaperone